MVAVAKRMHQPAPGRRFRERVFATSDPTLWPHMAIPWRREAAMPYPFNDPGVHYFYFARNGIYELAKLWGLAGQEVLFPAYFHGVELEALLAAGVKPRFFPVHERMRVDAAEVAGMITAQTRAVYLIHYAGFPGPVEQLVQVCRDRRIPLIEDCALALLSCLGARPLGSFGDAAVFCLYKMVPAADGGAVVLRGGKHVGLAEGKSPSFTSIASLTASSLLLNLEMRGNLAARLLRQAIRAAGAAVVRASGVERVATGTQHFDPAHLGLAMSDFSRSVLRAQDYAAVVERRRRNYLQLLGRLRDLSPPVFDELPAGVCPLFYPFRVRNKPAIKARLAERGVETVDFWRLGHPAVPEGAFPEVDELRQTVLWLPCHQDLTPRAVDRVAVIVREVVQEASWAS